MATEEEESWGDWIVGNVSDAANFFADNLAETRDVVADAATEIADSLGDDAATAARNAAFFGPVGLAAGGLIVAVVLNPSLLGNAGKSLKKLF